MLLRIVSLTFFFRHTKSIDNEYSLPALYKFKETLNRCMSDEIHLKFINVHRGVYTEIQLHKEFQKKKARHS